MSKNRKTIEAKPETKPETAKTEKPIIKAEAGKSETGFFRVTYKDGMKKDSKTQSLRAYVKDGVAIFSNGNFSQFGNNHAFTVKDAIKPFKLRLKKANIEKHVSIHGAESVVLKRVLECNPELY